MDPAYDAALLHTLFSQPPIGLHVLDQDLRIVRFNTGAAGVEGMDMSDAVGRRWEELGLVAPDLDRMLHRVLDTGEPVKDYAVRVSLRGASHEERVVSVSAFRLQDTDGHVLGVAGVVVDITHKDRAQRRLELLYRAGERIGTSLDVFRTAQELADVAVPEFADVTAVDVLDPVLRGEAPAPGPLSEQITVRRAGYRSHAAPTVRHPLEVGDVRIMEYGTPYTQSLSDLRPRLVRDLRSDDTWLARDTILSDVVRRARVHSLIAVPLAARGVVLGMTAFYRTEGSPPFEESDLGLAADLTARAAVCVDNARRYTREQTIARLTQRTLVPTRLPPHVAMETAWTYLPASGGAWYDVVPLSGARVALVAGDVSGHGMRAVTLMGQLRTAVAAFAAMDLQPAELLERLDTLTERLMREHPDTEECDPAPQVATCLYMVYDPVERCCLLSRAGHPPPVVAAPDGTVHVVQSPAGPRLGRGVASYVTAQVDVPDRSILALTNTALLRAREESALPVYRAALRDPARGLREMCDALMTALLPEPPADDALLLLARTRALSPDRLGSWSLPHAPESASEARRLVGERLAEWGLDGLVFSAQLIASELVTNAVRYSAGPVELRLIRDSSLICEVSDTSRAAPHPRQADADDEGGRGLFLVSEFTRSWGSRQSPRGKTIWADLPLAELPAT
ncbi:SpoIIE family protein phosphatase [Streptomyces sp. NPDC002004]